MLSETAIVVGDNVLRPGAPQFMYWNSVAGPYETQVVSLREYKQASRAVCVCVFFSFMSQDNTMLSLL